MKQQLRYINNQASISRLNFAASISSVVGTLLLYVPQQTQKKDDQSGWIYYLEYLLLSNIILCNRHCTTVDRSGLQARYVILTCCSLEQCHGQLIGIFVSFLPLSQSYR